MDKIELLIFDRMSFQALGHFKRGSAGKIDQKIYMSFSIPVLGTENRWCISLATWYIMKATDRSKGFKQINVVSRILKL